MKKKDLIKRCQEILHGYPVRTPLPENEDVQFLLDLFKSHPHYELKRGSGINHIFIDFTKYANKCFNVTRLDGSVSDISFTQCISPSSQISDIKAACRSAIRAQIVRFRNDNVKYGVSKCPFTGEVLTPDNTHIDHYDKPFNVVFSEWYLTKDPQALISGLNDTTIHGEMELFFLDTEIAKDFLTYHNANTHLRAVSVKANLSILK